MRKATPPPRKTAREIEGGSYVLGTVPDDPVYSDYIDDGLPVRVGMVQETEDDDQRTTPVTSPHGPTADP